MNWVCPVCGQHGVKGGFCLGTRCALSDCIPESKYVIDEESTYDKLHREQAEKDKAKVESHGSPYVPFVFTRNWSGAGIPNIGPPDLLNGVFDNAAGRCFDSRSDRKAFYRDNQLRRSSIGEARRNGMDGMDQSHLKRVGSAPRIKR